MIPFLESCGGNCQDAVIVVEDRAARLKPVGACEGTEIEQLHFNLIKYSGVRSSVLFY